MQVTDQTSMARARRVRLIKFGAKVVSHGRYAAFQMAEPTPKRIYKARRGLNDISFLSKSHYGRSLNRDKAVLWRMSA